MMIQMARGYCSMVSIPASAHQPAQNGGAGLRGAITSKTTIRPPWLWLKQFAKAADRGWPKATGWSACPHGALAIVIWQSDGFERAALNSTNPELTAAARYWASRSHVRCRFPEKAAEQLRGAAQFDETLYGMLAREQLGQELATTHADADFSNDDWKRLRRRGKCSRSHPAC